MYLANQMYLEDIIGLFYPYLNAIQEHHGYLILVLTQYMNDGLRFRTRIFPTEDPAIICSDIGDEACEIEHRLRKAIIWNCDKELVNCLRE